jgi:hypothetical protein
MTETTKFIITAVAAIIGSGLGTAIVGAWFKNRFDAQLQETQNRFDAQLEETRNRFTIGAASHMANVAFDKHVEFCEKYTAALNGALNTLFSRGPHQDILQDADKLVGTRLEWTLWITPEVEAKLQGFERALRTIGANAWLIAQLDPAHQDRTGSIRQAYDTFADVMGWPEWHGKPLTGDVAAETIIQGLREVLSVGDLRRLRDEMIKRAVAGLK